MCPCNRFTLFQKADEDYSFTIPNKIINFTDERALGRQLIDWTYLWSYTCRSLCMFCSSTVTKRQSKFSRNSFKRLLKYIRRSGFWSNLDISGTLNVAVEYYVPGHPRYPQHKQSHAPSISYHSSTDQKFYR